MPTVVFIGELATDVLHVAGESLLRVDSVSGAHRQALARKGRIVAECARLETVWGRKPLVGSNPTPSAERRT